MAKLIFGCGYLGIRVARRWLAAGEEVFAVTRSPERARTFAAEGLRPIVADVLDAKSLVGLPRADAVLYAVGFGRTASAPLEELYPAGLRNVLNALSAETDRVIYASSTGVYGQTDGETVDEDSPAEPTRAGGQACLAAERMLAEHRLGARSIVLRLAGLYGPGRIPHAAAIRRGESIAVAADGRLNLIQIDDAAAVVVAASVSPAAPRTYIVSDGHPVVRGEFYRHWARLLGAPEPRFVAPAADASQAARASSDKQLSNRRMLAELKVRLEYPDYRAGLKHALAAETAGEDAV